MANRRHGFVSHELEAGVQGYVTDRSLLRTISNTESGKWDPDSLRLQIVAARLALPGSVFGIPTTRDAMFAETVPSELKITGGFGYPGWADVERHTEVTASKTTVSTRLATPDMPSASATHHEREADINEWFDVEMEAVGEMWLPVDRTGEIARIDEASTMLVSANREFKLWTIAEGTYDPQIHPSRYAIEVDPIVL